MYDPTIVPHLVRVLTILLKKRSISRRSSSDGPDANGDFITSKSENDGDLAPVAYVSSALRNLTTLHLFFSLADAAGLEVIDVTEALMPLRILPKVYDFDMSQIRLYKVLSP